MRTSDARAQAAPGESTGRHGRFRCPQQGCDGHDEQRLEQRLRHDEVLDVHLVGVQQHRRRRQRRRSGSQPPVHQQRVEKDAEQDAREVLDGRYHPQLMRHGQCAQQQGVARRSDRIGHQGPGEPQVGHGVPGELQRRPIGDHGQCSQEDSRDDDDRDRDDDGGRGASAGRRPTGGARLCPPRPWGIGPGRVRPASVPIHRGLLITSCAGRRQGDRSHLRKGSRENVPKGFSGYRSVSGQHPVDIRPTSDRHPTGIRLASSYPVSVTRCFRTADARQRLLQIETQGERMGTQGATRRAAAAGSYAAVPVVLLPTP